MFTSSVAKSKIKPSGPHYLEPDVRDIVLEDHNLPPASKLPSSLPHFCNSPNATAHACTRKPLSLHLPCASSQRPVILSLWAFLPLPHALSPPLSPVISSCPPVQHPTFPRFLLSILTSLPIYPLRRVLGYLFILKTVEPTTAVRYMNFAMGKSSGDPDSEVPETGVGLEGDAEVLKDEKEESLAEHISSLIETPRDMRCNLTEKFKGLNMEFDHIAERNINGLSETRRTTRQTSRPSPFTLPSVPPRHPSPLSTTAACQTRSAKRPHAGSTAGAPTCLRSRSRTPASSPTPHAKATNKDQVGPMPRCNALFMRKRASVVPSNRLMRSVPNMPGFDSQPIKTIPESTNFAARLEAVSTHGGCAVSTCGEQKVSYQNKKLNKYNELFARGIHCANMFMDDFMTIAKEITLVKGMPYSTGSPHGR
ncbi:hypothetical protein NM688_g7319 [Phlebia brevispora]|uniref:Uncharacterized protein n=1 Tax=Phlebia brevispora TaxID=194682 RepID=A0ACC1S6N9_9APHY|nr:hypothetical protein NM688_g7319 [Phlebia brevispora]